MVFVFEHFIIISDIPVVPCSTTRNSTNFLKKSLSKIKSSLRRPAHSAIINGKILSFTVSEPPADDC